jgi:hypothetical protein
MNDIMQTTRCLPHDFRPQIFFKLTQENIDNIILFIKEKVYVGRHHPIDRSGKRL